MRGGRWAHTRDGMVASSKLPMGARPIRMAAPGLRAARETAGMSITDVGELCGYGPGVVASMEAGGVYHIGEISRVASVIPGHDLRLIRGEGPGGAQVTRASDITHDREDA